MPRTKRTSAAATAVADPLDADAALDPELAELDGADDAGLVEVDARGFPIGRRASHDIGADVHGDPNSADVSAQVRKALMHSDTQTISPDSIAAQQRIVDAPEPFDRREGSVTAIPQTNDPSVLAFGQSGNDPNRRDDPRSPAPDAMLLVTSSDDLDVAMGRPARERRVNVVFDWCLDREGRRLQFTRHYFTAGVLIDVFPNAGIDVLREVATKAKAIKTYNAIVPEGSRLGYHARVVGTPLNAEAIGKARAHEVLEDVADHVYQGSLGLDGMNRIHDMSAQALPERW